MRYKIAYGTHFGVHLSKLIKNETNLFESGGLKGKYFQFIYNALLIVLTTNTKAEPAFSAAGYLTFKGRSLLAD